MANTEPTAFQRVFPTAEFFRNGTLKACLWSTLGSLLLCVQLFNLYLFTGLIAGGGMTYIPAAERGAIDDLLGPDASPASSGPMAQGYGLLPLVVHDRDRVWGPALAAAYRKFWVLRSDVAALALLVAVAGIVSLIRRVAMAQAQKWHRSCSQELAARLRKSIHRQTLRLGPSDLEGREISQAQQHFTQDVEQLAESVYSWTDRLGRDPLQLLLLIGLAIAVHPVLAIECLIPLGVCWYLTQRQREAGDEARAVAAAQSAKDLRLLGESLMKTRLVRGYGMENFEQEQFQKYLQRYQEKSLASRRSWSGPGVALLVGTCLAVVLFLIGGRVLLPPQELSPAAGLLMSAALVSTWFPLRSLARVSREHSSAEQAALRIQTYLNRIPEVGQAVGAKFLQPLNKLLEFDGVTYSTPGKRVLLDGLKLKIPAGRFVAIVSPEPLESLSLAYLLPRFIEPQSGRIMIDGEDISWVTLESLRAETVFVGGKDPFFTGTVRENISCGLPNYSLQEVTEAAKVAHAHNFILKLPQGYETVIGEHGEQLDTGQSFRLGLARAVLRKPALLIIEEPLDPLDEDTKSMVDDAYKRIVQKRTVLLLPSRLSTLRRTDEIVLIFRGKVEAIGPHARLVQSCQLYRHWEYMRFNEFRREFDNLKEA